MELKLNDLEQHEKKLTEIISHAEEERIAIRTLINGMKLRQVGNSDNSLPVLNLRQLSVEKAVAYVIDSDLFESFTPLEVTEYLLKNGRWSDRRALRPNVGTALRKLLRDEKLTRDNEGTRNKPAYRYRKV